MKYAYPAIFTPEEEGGYSIRFTDIEGCYTQGEDIADGIEMAQDVLALNLYNLEESGATIPAPSMPKDIECADGEFVTMICCDTIEYRKMYDSKAIKKTLTIPAWLNTMAENNNINFSLVLQNALKQQLGVNA